MKDLIRSITKQEWRFWAKIVIAILILTSLSRIFAVFWTPPGYVWTGRTYFAPIDRFVYVSYIEQVKNGANILQDLYSAKGETEPMINLFWMSAGLLAKFTKLSPMAVMESLRILFAPALLLVLYLLISYFLKNIFERKLAFLLSVFGGGLGVWIYPISEKFTRGKAIVDNLPIDFNLPEAFTFLSVYYSAHFIASTTIFLFVLLSALLAIENKKLIYAVYAGVAGFVLLNFHPFSFISAVFILSAHFFYLLWKNRKTALFMFKYLAIFSLIVSPSALYLLRMLSTPWWQNQTWNSQTEVPNLIFIISGYGLLLFCAIAAIYKFIKNKSEVKGVPFLIIWFFSQIALIFLPISVQRRFLEGYQAVLSILAAIFLAALIKRRAYLGKGIFYPALLFIVAFSLSFVAVIYLDCYNFYSRIQSMYVEKEYISAIAAIREYTGPDDIILADIYSSNMIPGVALRRVFAGHGIETINFEYKMDVLTRFGTSASREERLAILKNNKIDYLFYDPGWNWGFDPDKDWFLKNIYQKGKYKFYEVQVK